MNQNNALTNKVNEYKVCRYQIGYLVSLLSPNTPQELAKELLETYYDILEQCKINGFAKEEYIVNGKPHLYNFLNENDMVMVNDNKNFDSVFTIKDNRNLHGFNYSKKI